VRPIATLSKGYKQRVGIAQAILHRPEILILDEPTSGLDPTQIVEIRDLIKRLSENTTVLLSTHILSEVEMTCERVLIIVRGELKADAPLDELRAAQQNSAVVAIDGGVSGAEDTLKRISGVKNVRAEERRGDYQLWRVSGDTDVELCPAIFKALEGKGWRVGELRSDRRNLEEAFRELAQSEDESEEEAA
jgi:ABC-2 type transport system ATP-binding protein